jgi:hypothetical protein
MRGILHTIASMSTQKTNSTSQKTYGAAVGRGASVRSAELPFESSSAFAELPVISAADRHHLLGGTEHPFEP